MVALPRVVSFLSLSRDSVLALTGVMPPVELRTGRFRARSANSRNGRYVRSRPRNLHVRLINACSCFLDLALRASFYERLFFPQWSHLPSPSLPFRL